MDLLSEVMESYRGVNVVVWLGMWGVALYGFVILSCYLKCVWTAKNKDKWRVVRTEFPKGYGVYNISRNQALTRGLTKEDAKARCRALNIVNR